MDLFKNIRIGIGRSRLTNKAEKIRRKPSYSNFNNIKEIGIVWDSSKTEEFHALSKFSQKMHEKNIGVSIIGYFEGKELPDQYTAIRYLSCIRRSEVNFLYYPVTSEANNFINFKFDVLIDINFNNILPLQVISSLSNACFKVGLLDSQISSVFDLTMDIKKPVTTEEYLNQVIYYLEMINSNSSAKTS
jgi:hypothetical protein